MRKILLMFGVILFSLMPVSANQFSKAINSKNINSGAVSVSVKDVATGNTVYTLNERVPRNPASTLKLITSFASYNTLGDDYKFSTKLYKTAKNDLYLKLGADPLLTSGDLNLLMKMAADKKIIEPKYFYIDDTIFDDVEWGEGWQWDDDLNPLMPKFSAYNIDGNLLNIEITPQGKHRSPSIQVKPYYPLTFMNMIEVKEGSGVKLARNNSIAPNILNATGTVSSQTKLKIPVNNVQLYFNLRLEDAIKSAKIDYYKNFYKGKVPTNSYLVGDITHSIENIMFATLKDSNNLCAESLFKVAGAVYSGDIGTSDNSLNMLNDYLKSLELNTSDIKIVDGSGVSKNNLVTSDFMVNYLVKIAKDQKFEDLKKYFAVPGEGTLVNRMLYLKNNLWAKTGTLSDVSAMAGYIKSRSGKLYAFDIMIQSAKTSSADKKNIEEQILRVLYAN